ncbi:MAG: thioredoxin-dependent thiol peroxidase [Bacteroidetes bacterium]|nr:thioredoxin-dependent thiol peroxidase [Bacteroidota bacterium]
MALPVGTTAPNFSTTDQNGNRLQLSDFRGKKIVLYFYPKDMTPGCTAEACNLRDNYKVLQKQGYEVLGISTDSEKRHRTFIEKENLPFRLLADTDRTVHAQYGTWVEKSMYGRKYMGTARITYIINEAGVITDVIEKVNTKDHTAQILGDTTLNLKKMPTSKGGKKPIKKVIKKLAKKVKRK